MSNTYIIPDVDEWDDDDYDPDEKLEHYEEVCSFLGTAAFRFKLGKVTHDCFIGNKDYEAYWRFKDGEHMITIVSVRSSSYHFDPSGSDWDELCNTVKADFLAHARGQKLKEQSIDEEEQNAKFNESIDIFTALHKEVQHTMSAPSINRVTPIGLVALMKFKTTGMYKLEFNIYHDFKDNVQFTHTAKTIDEVFIEVSTQIGQHRLKNKLNIKEPELAGEYDDVDLSWLGGEDDE